MRTYIYSQAPYGGQHSSRCLWIWIGDMDIRDFGLFFLEIPNTLVQNIYGCQSGNMDNHLLFTCNTLKYRMTCCSHHYGRTVPDYWSAKASLPTDQHKFFPDNFTQSLIGLPFLSQPVDCIYSELRVKIKTRLAKCSRYQKSCFCLNEET